MRKSRKKENRYQKLECMTGKVAYRDRLSALYHLAVLRKRDIVNIRNQDNLKVKRAYKCDKCDYWHLTSQLLKN